MSLRKHGHGEVILDDEDVVQKTAGSTTSRDEALAEVIEEQQKEAEKER